MAATAAYATDGAADAGLRVVGKRSGPEIRTDKSETASRVHEPATSAQEALAALLESTPALEAAHLRLELLDGDTATWRNREGSVELREEPDGTHAITVRGHPLSTDALNAKTVAEWFADKNLNLSTLDCYLTRPSDNTLLENQLLATGNFVEIRVPDPDDGVIGLRSQGNRVPENDQILRAKARLDQCDAVLEAAQKAFRSEAVVVHTFKEESVRIVVDDKRIIDVPFASAPSQQLWSAALDELKSDATVERLKKADRLLQKYGPDLVTEPPTDRPTVSLEGAEEKRLVIKSAPLTVEVDEERGFAALEGVLVPEVVAKFQKDFRPIGMKDRRGETSDGKHVVVYDAATRAYVALPEDDPEANDLSWAQTHITLQLLEDRGAEAPTAKEAKKATGIKPEPGEALGLVWDKGQPPNGVSVNLEVTRALLELGGRQMKSLNRGREADERYRLTAAPVGSQTNPLTHEVQDTIQLRISTPSEQVLLANLLWDGEEFVLQDHNAVAALQGAASDWLPTLVDAANALAQADQRRDQTSRLESDDLWLRGVELRPDETPITKEAVSAFLETALPVEMREEESKGTDLLTYRDGSGNSVKLLSDYTLEVAGDVGLSAEQLANLGQASDLPAVVVKKSPLQKLELNSAGFVEQGKAGQFRWIPFGEWNNSEDRETINEARVRQRPVQWLQRQGLTSTPEPDGRTSASDNARRAEFDAENRTIELRGNYLPSQISDLLAQFPGWEITVAPAINRSNAQRVVYSGPDDGYQAFPEAAPWTQEVAEAQREIARLQLRALGAKTSDRGFHLDDDRQPDPVALHQLKVLEALNVAIRGQLRGRGKFSLSLKSPPWKGPPDYRLLVTPLKGDTYRLTIFDGDQTAAVATVRVGANNQPEALQISQSRDGLEKNIQEALEEVDLHIDRSDLTPTDPRLNSWFVPGREVGSTAA